MEIANRQEIIAGACACIAAELGVDIKGIRVLSFKEYVPTRQVNYGTTIYQNAFDCKYKKYQLGDEAL